MYSRDTLLTSRLSSFIEDRTAFKLDHDIHHYESRKEQRAEQLYSTFGTSDLGLDLTLEAWPRMTQVFAAGSSVAFKSCPGRPSAHSSLMLSVCLGMF